MSEYIQQGALGLAFFLSMANVWLAKHAMDVIDRNTEALAEIRSAVREHTNAVREQARVVRQTNGDRFHA